MAETEITCNCGACVIRLKGEPETQFFCHCDDCQATSGGAYISVAVFAADDVEVVRGTLEEWTLRQLPRQRCATCGTSMTATVEPGKLTGVKGDRLPEGMFQPVYHQHCQYAVRPVVDDLPHYKGFAPEGGGTDERVAW